MKLVLISVLWFPVTSLLLIYSFIILLSSQTNKQNASFEVSPVYAQSLNTDNTTDIKTPQTDNLVDIRIQALSQFLESYKSPLIPYAETAVKIADRWGLDYALIPAIAMQESGGCKIIPIDSYNCWGFGIYGDKVTRFESYENAMNAVAKTIKETYIKNGLTNPTLLEDRWTPSSRGLWSYSVNYFIGKIKEIERLLTAS